MGLITPPTPTDSQDRTEAPQQPFCPRSGPLHAFLDQVLELNLALGSDAVVEWHGLRAPLVCDPTPEVAAVDFDAASKRAAEVLTIPRHQALAACDPSMMFFDAPLQPGRLIVLQMEAAYMRDIEAYSPAALAAYLGSSETPEVIRRDDRENDDERYRGVDRIVARGRRKWAALGAWPWAIYRPSGQLPRDWRGDDRALSPLLDLVRRSVEDAEWTIYVLGSKADRARHLLR